MVESYEFLSDERQLKLCNAGDVKKAESHHQQKQQKEQQQQQQRQQQEPPKAKPKAGRSQAEPPKQAPPTYASVDWKVKADVGGLLGAREEVDESAGAGGELRFSFSLQWTPKVGGMNGAVFSMTGLDAGGHPEQLIHWQSAAWGPEGAAGGGFEEHRRRFVVENILAAYAS